MNYNPNPFAKYTLYVESMNFGQEMRSSILKMHVTFCTQKCYLRIPRLHPSSSPSSQVERGFSARGDDLMEEVNKEFGPSDTFC